MLHRKKRKNRKRRSRTLICLIRMTCPNRVQRLLTDGNAGDDRIIGRQANDILEGGTGADDFVFMIGDGIDRIIDFEIGVDSIDLSGTALAYGDLTITDGAGFALVDYGDDLIRVDGVTAAQLTADQFDLA